MTIERVITSHSERAVTVEHGLIANEWAASASQTSNLLRILAKGKRPDQMQGLVKIADGFIKDISKFSDERMPRLKITQLFQYRVWDDVVGESENTQLASDLRDLLDLAGSASAEDAQYQAKIVGLRGRLEDLREKFDQKARDASKPSVLA